MWSNLDQLLCHVWIRGGDDGVSYTCIPGSLLFCTALLLLVFDFALACLHMLYLLACLVHDMTTIPF